MFQLRYRFALTIALCAMSWTDATSSLSCHVPGRIEGSTSALDIEFPFLVSIRRFNRPFCAGSIISSCWILTDAHCVSGIAPIHVTVHAGTNSLFSNKGVLVTASAVHYPTQFNDIALVAVSSSLTFNFNIQPIALPAEGELVAGDEALVAGWEFTSLQGCGSYLLQYARVPILNQSVCNRQLDEYLTDRMICAGYAKGGIDACQMDSGAPLVMDRKLVGIVSGSSGCAQPNMPVVYTRVSAMIWERWARE